MTQATPNFDPEALKVGLVALQADAAEARELVIPDADTYAVVGSILIARLKEYDAAKELRDRVTKPLHDGWKKTCALFKPALDAHEQLIAALKKAIGDYDLRELEAKEAASREARAVFAAPTPDVSALTEALAVANAPLAHADGVGTKFVWKVKRIVAELLPDSYWVPDMTAIDDEASRQGTGGDAPPVIPGVIFERVAQVSGRRK